MKNILLIPVLAVCAAGCAAGPITPASCFGSNGRDVTIRYGDSKIDVTHKVRVRPDEKIVLRLMPDNQSDENVDYQTLNIELRGKTRSDRWLDRTLNANDNNTDKAIICVDGRTPGVYRYDVIVPGVGEIDPRVDVGNNIAQAVTRGAGGQAAL